MHHGLMLVVLSWCTAIVVHCESITRCSSMTVRRSPTMSTESNGATVYTACFYCDSEDEFHGTVDEHDVAEFHCHKCEARFTVANWSEFFNDDEQVIGANAKVKWLDTGEVVDRYFSFGDIKDDAECDEYGIPDTEVFFYCGSEQEFEALQSEESGEDFIVLEYELVTR